MPPTLEDSEIQRIKGQQGRRIQKEVPEILNKHSWDDSIYV